MKTINVTADEWKEFLEVSRAQMQPRSRYWSRYSGDWCAVFSINSLGNKWSFATYGHTPFRLRNDLRGIKIVDTLREEYDNVRAEGGRVFVNRNGAFYKTTAGELEQFAALCILPILIVPTERGYKTPGK